MILLLEIVGAAIPSLLLIFYFYKKDSAKSEPPFSIFLVFLAGFISVIPAAVMEIFLMKILTTRLFFINVLLKAFIVAAFTEELVKLIAVKVSVFNSKHFDEMMDGILYTATASLGFAFFENILYTLENPVSLLLRAFTAVPLHAIASGIMGYYIAASKFQNRNNLPRGFLLAVLYHGVYDALLFSQTVFAFLIIPVLIIGLVHLRRLIRKAIADDRLHGRISGY